MLIGRGQKWCSQLLCSRRGVSVNAASQGRAPRRVNNLPTMSEVFTSLFRCHVHPGYLPVFSPGARQCHQGYPSQACQPLEPKPLSPAACKNSKNSVLLIFQGSGFGDIFSLFPCVLLSLSPFSTMMTIFPLQYL